MRGLRSGVPVANLRRSPAARRCTFDEFHISLCFFIILDLSILTIYLSSSFSNPTVYSYTSRSTWLDFPCRLLPLSCTSIEQNSIYLEYLQRVSFQYDLHIDLQPSSFRECVHNYHWIDVQSLVPLHNLRHGLEVVWAFQLFGIYRACHLSPRHFVLNKVHQLVCLGDQTL